MARLKKPEHKNHVLCMRNDNNNGRLIIVRGGKHTYISIGVDGNPYPISAFSGPKTLEKFAWALLKAIKPMGKGDV